MDINGGFGLLRSLATVTALFNAYEESGVTGATACPKNVRLAATTAATTVAMVLLRMSCTLTHDDPVISQSHSHSRQFGHCLTFHKQPQLPVQSVRFTELLGA